MCGNCTAHAQPWPELCRQKMRVTCRIGVARVGSSRAVAAPAFAPLAQRLQQRPQAPRAPLSATSDGHAFMTPQLARRRLRESLSAQADATMKLFPRMSREEATARVKAAFDDPSRSEWDAGLADAAESAQPLLALLRGNGPGEEPQQSAGPREASSPRREPSAQAPGTARGLWAAVSSPASADRPSRPASPRSPGSGQREGSSAWSAPADRAASPSRGGAARTRAEQPVRDEPEASAPPGRFLAETSTFASAGLGRRLQRRLSTLGFRRPSVVQARALPVALAGRHAVIHAETGSGKTLAFALPLLQRLEGLSTDGTGPLGLVLVPSPELCEQVAAVLAVLDPGCKPQALHGSTSREAQLALARGGGESRVLVATPQSLLKVLGMPVKGAIALLSHVRVVAVDEADFLLSSLRGPVERCLWMAGQPSRADRQARSALAAAAIDAGKPIAELPPPIPRGARPRPVGEPGSATGGSANWAGGRLPRLGRDSSAQFLFAAATLSDTTHRAVGEWFRRHFEGAEVVRTGGDAHLRLRILGAIEARLVRADRRGKQVFYATADAHVDCILKDMIDHVAEPHPEDA